MISFCVCGFANKSDRDAEVTSADEACHAAAKELEQGKKGRSKSLSEKQREAFARRRAERAEEWTATLTAQVFGMDNDLWVVQLSE